MSHAVLQGMVLALAIFLAGMMAGVLLAYWRMTDYGGPPPGRDEFIVDPLPGDPLYVPPEWEVMDA